MAVVPFTVNLFFPFFKIWKIGNRYDGSCAYLGVRIVENVSCRSHVKRATNGSRLGICRNKGLK